MKKSTLIKLVCTLLSLLMLLSVCACGSKDTKVNQKNPPSSTSKQSENEESKSEIIDLAESCDYILAEGEDWNGCFYQLVLNENDGYEIGVIKDNEWLRKPSADGTFMQYDSMETTIKNLIKHKRINDFFMFIGNGCFYASKSNRSSNALFQYEGGLFYNAEKDLYLNADSDDDPRYFYFQYEYYDVEKSDKETFETALSYRGSVVDNAPLTVELLDTNTMQYKTVLETNYKTNSSTFTLPWDPISEGIFAITYLEKYQGYQLVFFDATGKELFRSDLFSNLAMDNAEAEGYNGYDKPTVKKVMFKNGICTYSVNDLDDVTRTYTVDTKGNIISVS